MGEETEIMKASELKYYAQRLLLVKGSHLICFVTFSLSSKFPPEINGTNNYLEALSM